MLQVRHGRIVDDQGKPIHLRGTCIGGWMNLENIINGYPGDERGMRRVMAEILGPAKAHFFFDRMLDYFLGEADIAFIKSCGGNLVRLPLNYRHLESDAAPYQYMEAGFQRLDRVLEWCTRYGLYAILDLHAVQGFQNTDWHCDNSSRHTFFWHEKQFQDRFIALWEELARRYNRNPTVAGYNLMNEPIVNAPAGRLGDQYQPDWETLNAIYRRAVNAIRAIDPDHIIFLEGDYFSKLFDGLDAPFAPNLVYSSHNYTRAGHGPGPYPGMLDGEHWDRQKLRQVFDEHPGTRYTQQHQVPLWVGEFGAKIDGSPEEWPDRCRSLDDQLGIFAEYGAHWTIWTFKDVGRQGWVILDPASDYMQMIAPITRTKRRLGLETWWTGGHKDPAVQSCMTALADTLIEAIDDAELDFAPAYLGQAVLGGFASSLLQPTYARRFIGMSETELDRVLQAFAFDKCKVHKGKAEILKKHMSSPTPGLVHTHA